MASVWQMHLVVRAPGMKRDIWRADSLETMKVPAPSKPVQVPMDDIGGSSDDSDTGHRSEDSWEEETQDIVAVGPADSSSYEDEGPSRGDRDHLWIYQMKNVAFLIKAFRRAYAEKSPGILRRLWLSPCDVRHAHTRSARSARERLHNCAKEIRKLWNKTKRVCVRKRICTYGNVHWNVRQRLRTAAVYDLLSDRRISYVSQNTESDGDFWDVHGERAGKGYYSYEKGSRAEQPAPELDINDSSLIPDGKVADISDEEVVEMIFFGVVNEACRVLDEDVVVRSADLDIASVLGMGFPAYRGGEGGRGILG